jgi:hypothetical protein
MTKKALSCLVLFFVLSSSGTRSKAVVQGGGWICTVTEGPPGSEVSLLQGKTCPGSKLPCVSFLLGESGEKEVLRADGRRFSIKTSRGFTPADSSPLAPIVVTLSREDDDGFAVSAVGVGFRPVYLHVKRPNQEDTVLGCSELL